MLDGTAPVLTCSWSDCSFHERTTHLHFEAGGMEAAEELVQVALSTSPDPTTRVPLHNPAAAPSLHVSVGRCGVVALCLVANARVLEIHDGGAVTTSTVPLLTQEAQLSDASTGLFAHFLCHGGGGALFPAHRSYQVKLFGRRPREEVCVVRICFVLLAAVEGEEKAAVVGDGDMSLAPHAPAAAAAAAAAMSVPSPVAGIAEFVFALQRQLVAVEGRVVAALTGVADRLSRLEVRVDHLETVRTPFVAEDSPKERSGDDAEAEPDA